MTKIIIPMLTMFYILNKSRGWPIMGGVLLMMTLLSLPNTPIFHLSSSSSMFYIDSLSAPLISLTLWISALMILASQKIFVQSQSTQKFLAMILTLSTFLLITFSMNNLIMFYIFFEASLIPTFLLVLGWGYQPERLQASMYLLLYTITASLPLLLMILLMSASNKSTFMFMPQTIPFFSSSLMAAWWLMMILAFMVKMPMYSLHLWLPKAHVEAPVAGSMILAAILLKLGSYALIRVSFLFPMMNQALKSILIPIAMFGAVFTSLICLRQTDLKALIAYSSVGHMGLLIAGTLTNYQWGWQGALTVMISHGLTSSALFSMANSIYETTQTRSLFLTKGILAFFPPISLMFFILSASNMAAPPSINLLGEVALMAPTLSVSTQMIFPLMALTFLGGAYSLHMYTTTNHGQPMIYSNPVALLVNRNLMIPIFHAIPSVLLITKIDMMNPWI